MRLFSALTECFSQQSHSEWICGFEKMAKEYLREASGSEDVKVGMNSGQLPCVRDKILAGVNLAGCALDCEAQIGKEVTRNLFYRYLHLVNQKCIWIFKKHFAEL